MKSDSSYDSIAYDDVNNDGIIDLGFITPPQGGIENGIFNDEKDSWKNFLSNFTTYLFLPKDITFLIWILIALLMLPKEKVF